MSGRRMRLSSKRSPAIRKSSALVWSTASTTRLNAARTCAPSSPSWRWTSDVCAILRRRIMYGGSGVSSDRSIPYCVKMKIATWNVNGIRARQAQLCEWLERDRPEIVCLQELKAETGQIPEQCKLVEYHAFFHGLRAYSGVSLHVRKDLCAAEPVFSHPEFDMESRIVQVEVANVVYASVYVP